MTKLSKIVHFAMHNGLAWARLHLPFPLPFYTEVTPPKVTKGPHVAESSGQIPVFP